jgi:predicted Fe-Mo cluster-binding NifX family protein
MKIAIPIWEGRVSPVMDTAQQLLVVEVRDGRERSRTLESMPRLHPVHLVRFIGDLGIDLVICGSVSRQLEWLLELSGTKVIPWIRGNVDKILTAYASGDLQDGSFSLPGCRSRFGPQRRGRRRGQGRCSQYRRYPEEDL